MDPTGKGFTEWRALVPCTSLDREHVKYRHPSGADEVSTTDSLGGERRFKAGKDGTVEVPEKFQEVTSQLISAGWEPVDEEESG